VLIACIASSNTVDDTDGRDGTGKCGPRPSLGNIGNLLGVRPSKEVMVAQLVKRFPAL
jgi:hypothetical protein